MRLKLLLGLAAFSAVISLSSATSSALSGSEFNAANIMDDSVFFNGSSMSAMDVQVTLNEKFKGEDPSKSCDTNGTKPYGGTTRAQYGTSKGYPPPYICLKDYIQDTTTLPAETGLCNGFTAGRKSAAQIIQEVSASCGVNPRVVLVLLQKEQSLITDDWPWSKQYTSATGYACPDTAACDPEFAGFFKQIYYGVRQFKKYSRDESSFRYRAGRVNYVQYNPNTGCGGTNIYIQNQTTAGLYNYTPYQPNAAALNNLYGTGDGCSAYGNRNFWRMYNDWFGPTSGSLIRSLTSPTLYYSDGTSRYLISSMDVASQYGLGLGDVRYMHQEEVNMIPLTNSPNTQNLSQVIKSSSDSDSDGASLYLVSGGRKYKFQSMDQFSGFGFSTNHISYMGITNIQRLATYGLLKDFLQAPSQYVYKAEAGKKRVIFSLDTFREVNPSEEVSQLTEYTLTTVTPGEPLITGTLVVKEPNGTLWLYRDNQAFRIPGMSTYNCWKLSTVSTGNFLSYNQAQMDTTPNPLSCAVQQSDGAKYLMNNVNKIIIQPKWGFSAGISPPDQVINKLGSVGVDEDSAFKSSASNSLYIFESGKKRQLTDMNALYALGMSTSDIVTVHPDLISNIPTGNVKRSSGSLLTNNSGSLYLISDDKKLYIGSVEMLNAFGLDKIKPVVANDQVLNEFDPANLQMIFSVSGQAHLTESATKWAIPSSLNTAFGITPSTPGYNPYTLPASLQQKTITQFLKSPQSGTIYYMDAGKKRPVSSWQRLGELGGQNSITTLSSWALGSISTGTSI